MGRSRVLNTKPVAYLTCNGSPPVGDKPSLMTFSDAETLFHEFGHGLQHMLTHVEEGDAAGINNVEWDAVELPSQFMENWCYDVATVYDAGMAKHYETGEPLPRELFDKLCEQKTFQAGMGMCRQLFFGALDIELHHRYDPTGEPSPFDVQQALSKDYTVIPPLPEDRFLCGFGHIFAGGYAAGGISGGAFNPAVALGVDVGSAGQGVYWSFIYFAFEFIGAALAASVHKFLGKGDYSLGQKCVSEFLGTFFLVFTVGLNVAGGSPAGALSIGASLMCMIYALGGVSGANFNPEIGRASCRERV